MKLASRTALVFLLMGFWTLSAAATRAAEVQVSPAVFGPNTKPATVTTAEYRSDRQPASTTLVRGSKYRPYKYGYRSYRPYKYGYRPYRYGYRPYYGGRAFRPYYNRPYYYRPYPAYGYGYPYSIRSPYYFGYRYPGARARGFYGGPRFYFGYGF